MSAFLNLSALNRDLVRVYLDNCIFNRPFDDQSQIRIKIETEAIGSIFNRIVDGSLDLVWSTVIDFENEKNPTDERRDWVASWKLLAIVDLDVTKNTLEKSKVLIEFGFKKLDAIHLTVAEQADYFVTTDEGILKRSKLIEKPSIMDPTEFLRLIGG